MGKKKGAPKYDPQASPEFNDAVRCFTPIGVVRTCGYKHGRRSIWHVCYLFGTGKTQSRVDLFGSFHKRDADDLRNEILRRRDAWLLTDEGKAAAEKRILRV